MTILVKIITGPFGGEHKQVGIEWCERDETGNCDMVQGKFFPANEWKERLAAMYDISIENIEFE